MHRDILEKRSGNHNFDCQAPAFLSIDSQAENPLSEVATLINDSQARILFCAESAGRRESLLDLLSRHHIKPEICDSWQAFIVSKKRLAITVGPLETGLQLSDTIIIAEPQLFGQRVMQTRRRRKTPDNNDAVIKNLTELRIGAPVVHLDHGVGRYHGLQKIGAGGETAEF